MDNFLATSFLYNRHVCQLFCWLFLRSHVIHYLMFFGVKLESQKYEFMLMRGCYDIMSPSNEPACDFDITSSLLLRYSCTEHSSRMRTNRTITRLRSEWVATRPIVDRQTHVKTLLPPCGRKKSSSNCNFLLTPNSLIRFFWCGGGVLSDITIFLPSAHQIFPHRTLGSDLLMENFILGF